MVDKDRPVSWRPYKSIHCKDCIATCCTMPLEVRISDLIRLGLTTLDEVGEESKKEIQKVAKRLVKEGIIKNYRESTGLFLMLSRPNGDCQFLNKERLCTAYDKRPDTCQKFPAQIGLRVGFCPYIKKV